MSCKRHHSSNSSSPVCPDPTLDCTPPTVQSVSPTNGATAVPLNTQILATFSESIQPATLSTNTFTVSTIGVSGTLIVSGTVTYADATKTATFVPAAQLSPNTIYSATITTGVEDLAMNNMAALFSWSFTTGNAADLAAPQFSGNDPQLVAQATSSNSISLSWTAATDPGNVTPQNQLRYEICRSTVSTDCVASPFPATGGNVALYETTGGTTTLGVTGLTKSTTYYFVVRAKDLANNVDANAAQKSAATFGDWVSLPTAPTAGASLNNNTSRSASNPSIAVVGTVPYLVWEEVDSITTLSDIYLRTFDANSKVWSPVATLSAAGSVSHQPRVASNRAVSPIPYIVYGECDGSGNTCQVLVKQKSGSTWAPVGGSLNADATKSAGQSAVAFDGGNVPYVVWSEFNRGGVRQIYVKHFDGTNWIQDGPTSLNKDAAQDGFNPSIAINGTTIRVAWTECMPTTNNCQLYVKKWDIGASVSWSPTNPTSLKATNSTTSPPANAALALISGSFYIAWHEVGNVYIREEQADGSFALVGSISNHVSASTNTPLGGTASTTQIPYVVFADDTNASVNSGPDLIVQRWNGTNWVTEGSGKLNMTGGGNFQTMNSSIGFYQGTPYVAWMERGTCLDLINNPCGTTNSVDSQIYVKRLE